MELTVWELTIKYSLFFTVISFKMKKRPSQGISHVSLSLSKATPLPIRFRQAQPDIYTTFETASIFSNSEVYFVFSRSTLS